MQIAQKFEYLLEAYPRPDGRTWGGQDLQDASGGVVTRSYVTNLRKGRIENPGFEKLRAIAKVMGFPPRLWFEDDLRSEGTQSEAHSAQRDFAEKLEYLFQTVHNEKTGKPLTNAEVSRMSLGDLAVEDVERLRSGEVASPSFDQVIALADIFGVHPSYFLNREEKPPLLDEETMRALRDETTNAILHKSIRLPDREREMILGIVEQFEDLREMPDGR